MLQGRRYKRGEGDDRVPTHTQQSDVISGEVEGRGPWGI